VSNPRGKQAVKASLGYLPQELGLYPDLTAWEFLDYIALLKGVTDRTMRRSQLVETLELVGLTQDSGRRMRTYSGGMKRRVGIAQALIGTPRLLIVDEPTSGLDPEERVRLRNLLSVMATRSMVILSTHIIEDISQSCNDMAVLDHGQVLFHGNPSELIARVRGLVWTVLTRGETPDSGLVIVSTMKMQDGIQYRVVGNPSGHSKRVPVEPSLEDGYLWLMHSTHD
jgi:ABC-type multidrug transport system ATPase subunit